MKRSMSLTATIYMYCLLTILAVMLLKWKSFGTYAIIYHQNQSETSQAWSFLENYGYLPAQDNAENAANLLGPYTLRGAILDMQMFAKLPLTGQLDQQTLAKMNSPRCGLPDKLSISSSSSSKNKQRSRLARFATYGPKWNKNPITWSLVQQSQNISSDHVRETLTRAFNVWQKASKSLRFEERYNDHNADILIGFYSRAHAQCGTRQSFDGPGGKLAHAFAPPNGDIHFDDDEDWTSQQNSLYWTAIHEIGHSLGFAHTADESSIMFPYYQDHGNNFELLEVDKAGVRYLYGNSDTETTDTLPLPERKPEENESDKSKSTTQTTNDAIQCATSIDAIASIRGDIFVFKKNSFWWFKQTFDVVREEAIPVTQYFDGFPSDIPKVDAVYERKSDQKIMFFIGKQYWLFIANRYYDGPKPLTDLGLPNELEHIDAIINWSQNGRTYIFTGEYYWRLNEEERHVEADYPRHVAVWRGVPFSVDTAFTWNFDSATYFFKDELYWKFDNNEMSIDIKYPKLMKDFLFKSYNCPINSNAENLVQLQSAAYWPQSTQSVIHVTFILNLLICAWILH